MPGEVLPLIHGPRNGDVEEADHHFVVCLVAPCDSRVRVGIVSILTRIVVPGNRLNFRPCFHPQWFRKTIAELPEKIVVHSKQCFDVRAVVNDVVLESFAAQMHMRKEAEQRRIIR